MIWRTDSPLALHVHLEVDLAAAQHGRLTEGLEECAGLDAATRKLEGDGRLWRTSVDDAGNGELAAAEAGVDLADRELAAGKIEIDGEAVEGGGPADHLLAGEDDPGVDGLEQIEG